MFRAVLGACVGVDRGCLSEVFPGNGVDAGEEAKRGFIYGQIFGRRHELQVVAAEYCDLLDAGQWSCPFHSFSPLTQAHLMFVLPDSLPLNVKR